MLSNNHDTKKYLHCQTLAWDLRLERSDQYTASLQFGYTLLHENGHATVENKN